MIDEFELVSQAREGDLKSFSALVELYQERAIRVAYSLVRNMEDAKDLAQDAFVKAYEGIRNFRLQSRFFTWFYRILVNVCKDSLRKKKVRGFISFWKIDEGGIPEDGVETVTDTMPNAFQEIKNRELEQKILKALEKLPFRQRSVFALRYLEGLSIEEIAESLTISSGAVKAHLWQAGQKMRKSLESYWREDP